MSEPLVVEVFHPYRGQDKHQLTIAVGEKLTVLEKDASGWWAGRNAKGKVGLFPSTYTRKATTMAPSADVTREVVAARILSELNSMDCKDVPNYGSHLDVDIDGVFALSDHELEREIRRLIKERDNARRQNTERLNRIVEMTLANRHNSDKGPVTSDDATPNNNTNDVELQRLKIGKKRLEELVACESQLRSEAEEWRSVLSQKKLELPECMNGTWLPAPLKPASFDAPQQVTKAPAVIDIIPTPTVPDDSTEDDESWLAGVTDPKLQQYLRGLHKKLFRLDDELDTLESTLEPLTVTLATIDETVSNKQTKIDQLSDMHQDRVRELFEHWEARVTDAHREYTDLKSDGLGGPKLVASLQDQIALLEKQVEAGKKQHKKVDAEVEHQKVRRIELETQLELTSASQALQVRTEQALAEVSVTKARTLEIEAEGKVLMQNDQVEYRKLERKRREVYNQIQELKGNLRVYCRIKPRGPSEQNACVTLVDDMTVRVFDPTTEQSQEYEFDFVIGESATQEEIFEEVRPLATSVLDGFNVCIFAYGQTGSGKTYTMEGPPTNRGINFRAVHELFTIASERGDEYHCTLNVSILEVYNDKLFDLQNKRTQCKIRWGGEAIGVVVEPLVRTRVTNANDVQDALEKAYRMRSVAGTECNAHSSRSHCILTIYVDATNSATQNTITGKLHLIDLAGSERVKNSGVEGDRLKEATHINTSLTHLKTVIQGLANKSTHVAYRNSTLTSMLQDSLGGNCKCLMFANVSAISQNIPESICTMKYAAEARKVEVGKVMANVRKS